MFSKQTLPQYDELWVVSDIHMGGRPGFQILKHGPRLGEFIKHLSTNPPKGEVALVLNGDIIDSLAEEIEGYIAMEEAEKMMKRISEEKAFKPVWDGLQKFVSAARRHLIIIIGNHDIELALPQVELWIRRKLAGDNLQKNGRIHFATHGAGFGCKVGGSRVFCTHGNEVDGWNMVDHERLGQLGNALNAGRPVDRAEWEPNAGTRLVMRVMNKVKAQYPFVDLLKPETKPLLGVLAVIAPHLVRDLKVTDAAAIIKDRIRGALEKRGLLSAEAEDLVEASDFGLAADTAMPELLGNHLREAVEATGSVGHAVTPEELLREVDNDFIAGKSAMDALDDAGREETLGVVGMIVDRIRGVGKVEALRNAMLDWLENDDTFNLDKRDQTFREIAERVGPDVDFVITGHTHLQRAIRIDDGVDRYYYNCGTWIRLIRFTKKLLESQKEFRKVYSDLEARSMTAIDNAEILDHHGHKTPLVLDRTAAVCISSGNNGVVGRLYHVTSRDDGSDMALQLVDGSEFWRR